MGPQLSGKHLRVRELRFPRPPLNFASYTIDSILLSGNYDILDDEASARSFAARLDEHAHGSSTKRRNFWKSSDGAREGSFTVTIDDDVPVEFCLLLDTKADDDQVVSGRDQVVFHGLPVGFSLYVRPATLPRTLPDGVDGPDAKRALDVVEKATNIYGDWRLLLDHFDFLRNREAQHTVLTSQILSRVMGWTLLEAFLVIAMATGQVLYWKKFFEQRRYL